MTPHPLRSVVVTILILAFTACGGGAGSEPMRRIEALEARVEQLERAVQAGSTGPAVQPDTGIGNR